MLERNDFGNFYLYVALMPHTKFLFNLTNGFGEVKTLFSNYSVGALIRNVGPSDSMIRLSFNTCMVAVLHT